jgi:transposase
MQFAEDLTDRAAANVVRSHIDWKYALSLDLTDPGFHYSVLAKFRKRLISGEAEQVLLDALLERLQEQGFLKAGGHARTDSTYVLAAIRACNRLECVGETLRAALNDLAVIDGRIRSSVSSSPTNPPSCPAAAKHRGVEGTI